MATRFLFALFLALSVSIAHALTRFCNSATPQYVDEGVDPLELVWDVDGGGSSDYVSPLDAIGVLNYLNLSPKSPCRINTVVTITDSASNILFVGENELSDDNNIGALLRGIDKDEVRADSPFVFTSIHGTAAGCTTEEVRTFSVVIEKSEAPETADAIDPSLTGFGSFLVKKRETKTVRFSRFVNNKAIGGDGKVVGPALQLDCPGGAKPLPKYVDDDIDRLDLIWDVADGGTVQIGEDEQASLLVAVSPQVLNQTCEIPNRGQFLPKVKIEMVVSYPDGETTLGQETLTGELDIDNPAQVFDFPQAYNGGRKQYGFSARAVTPGCVAARGGQVSMVLRTESETTGKTRVEQRLPIIVRKVPPEPILDAIR
jgi:hypothetical protein